MSTRENTPGVRLDLHGDVVDLTAVLCDIGSVSGDEERIADAVEAALRQCGHLEVLRDADAVMARTNLGRAERVVVAGHLDTVPHGTKPDGTPNFPTWRVEADDGERLYGRGTCDMLGGVAAALSAAASVAAPNRDVTYVFYDHEEVDDSLNGLRRVMKNHPDWFSCDFAILGEPTSGRVEGGCNGTIRVVFTAKGVPAHSGRAWLGDNAIHKMASLLTTLRDHEAGEREVDGLVYRQSLSAVRIDGGVAGNVVPDTCSVMVNYRFAPDRTDAEAVDDLVALIGEGFEVEVVDSCPGARPGLHHRAVADFVERTGSPALPKLGWTDVSRFSAIGVPAINFGPGDPLFAHKDDEFVRADEVRTVRDTLVDWLSAE